MTRRRPYLIHRLIFPVLVAVVVGFGTVSLWEKLKHSHEEQVAAIAEAESYATRSQLVQRIELLLENLGELQLYWEEFQDLSLEDWGSSPFVGLEQYSGLLAIVWHNSTKSQQFVYTAVDDRVDSRPSDSTWQQFDALFDRNDKLTRNSIVGPVVYDNGRRYLEFHRVVSQSPKNSRMVAIFDGEQLFSGLLADDSPGYAIGVFAGDTLLYQKDEPAGTVPDLWIRQGVIETSTGTKFRVMHSFANQLANSFMASEIDAMLVIGLVMSGLIGALIFEHGRASSRATAAEVAEKEISTLNRDLEQEIEHRTGELAHRTRDLQTLTDSVSHDLRNPLNNISVNVQVLEQGFAKELGKDGLGIVRQLTPNVQRMTDILDRLLGLSEVSHATFTREEIDMRDLIKSVYDDLVTPDKRDGIVLQVDSLPPVQADRKLTEVLILNLLGNALKFSSSRPTQRIEVTATTDSPVTTYSISDNGVGFDENAAEKIFDAFERMDAKTTSEGVGLGLTIVARIVQRHEGRIWAEGEPEQGATFHFTLEPDLADQAAG